MVSYRLTMKRPSRLRAAWTASRIAGRRLLGLTPGAADDALAVHLADQLDRMKGMAMKVGQVMSYMDVPVPPSVQDHLARLQTGVLGMPSEQALEVLQQSLGSPVTALFDDFDLEPVAAASIGQVHRARFGEQAVAVKIQYPDVAATFTSDMSIMRRIGVLATAATAADGRAIVEELAARLDEECDYAREAIMQQAFKVAFADDNTIHIPQVVFERSSAVILTTHWVDGERFESIRRTQDGARRSSVARAIAQFSFRSIYELAAVQADPHPGNYIFEPDGRTTMLDFGCTRQISMDLIEKLKRLIRALRDSDRSAFRQASYDIDMVGRPKRFDFDHHFVVMAHLFEPLLSPGFRFTPAYTAKTAAFNSVNNPNAFSLAIPPQFVWILRLQLGLWAVLAKLEPDIDFVDDFAEILDRPVVPLRPPGAAQA